MRSEGKKNKQNLRMALCSDGVSRTPDEFLDKYTHDYKKIGEFPWCILGCQLIIAGMGSEKIDKHYRHHPGSNCVYAQDTPFTRSLKDAKWDPESGKRLLREFCTDRNLAECYRALMGIFRLNHLDTNEFYRFCMEAHKRRIWHFSGIDLQSIPYVMASLRVVNRYDDRDDGEETGLKVRYSMQAVLKLDKTGIRSVWEGSRACHLRVRFVNDGSPGALMRHSPVSVPDSDIESSRRYVDHILGNEDLMGQIRRFCCERNLFHDRPS